MDDNRIKNPAVIRFNHSPGVEIIDTKEELTGCYVNPKFPRNVGLHPDYVSQLPSVVPLGHVRVRLTTRPIQHVDMKIIRTGGYKELRSRDYFTIGAEGVGIIHEIGEDVKGELRQNQRVMPVLFWDNLLKKGAGSWQFYVDVAEENVFPLPDVSKESADYVPDEVAAQFVITPWTALGLFHTAVAGIPEGGFLLLSAPSSTIGRHVLGISKSKNINVIAVVRKDEQKILFTEMGVEHVICANSSKEVFAEQVKKLTGEGGAHAAIDGVGAETTMKLGACLRDEGELLIVDNAAGTDSDDHVKISLSDLKRKIQVKWWTLTDYVKIRIGKKDEIRETMTKLYNETLNLYKEKYLIFPTHEKIFTFDELAEALDLIGEIRNDFHKCKVLLVNHKE
ncbi:hypothetical protein Mapa_017684 [Marchantia paleacea]|nr:hypothetical protein Mapa_017684 [Marchantia paleacea]